MEGIEVGWEVTVSWVEAWGRGLVAGSWREETTCGLVRRLTCS